MGYGVSSLGYQVWGTECGGMGVWEHGSLGAWGHGGMRAWEYGV